MKCVARFLFTGFLILAPSLLCAAEVEEIKSPKGISAWLVEDHSLPIISMSFSWNGGIEHDEQGKEGLSHMAADMLNEGAGADDANTFKKKLEDNAISLSFQAQRDNVIGQLRTLKETLPIAETLFHNSLTSPRFDNDDFQNKKAETLSLIKRYQADPDWMLTRLMMQEVFAGHAYNKRTLGTEKTVNAISTSDLRGWHKKLGSKGLLVSVTGDMTKEELGAFLDKTFGDLPATEPQQDAPDTDLKGKKETFLLKYKSPQTGMLLVWPGIGRKDKDWYALEVMNYILGGGSFSSRLMDEIREKRGLTYGINSGPSNFEHAATYTIQASFKNEKAGEVLALVKKEIARIKDTKASADEIKAAKDYLIGAYALSLTSTSRVAEHYLAIQQRGLTKDNQQIREAGIKAVTAEDIQAIAQRILVDDAMISFFVGQPQGITPTKTFDSVE